MLPGVYIAKKNARPLVCQDNKGATIDLCEYLIKRLPQVVSEDGAGVFEAVYYAGSCDFQFFSAEEYPAVCKLALQACDEVESLKPYKAQLKAALEADPRFKQAV